MSFAFSFYRFKKFALMPVFIAALFLNLPKVFAVTIDGGLSDWGVTPGVFGSSDWTPNNDAAFIQEDQSPNIDFLSPGWGGQLFDAEALYFKREGMSAYFALVTGFPFSGAQGYQFGDIAFDFDSDGSYEFGFETRGNGGFTKGSLYGSAAWLNPSEFPASKPFDLKTGSLIDAVDYATGKITLPKDTHYLLEFGIPIELFGAFWDPQQFENPDFTIHWTMGCGNDVIDLHVSENLAVPEPASASLFLMGLSGMAFLNKKRLLRFPWV